MQNTFQVFKIKNNFVFPDAVYQSERKPGIFAESSGSHLQSLPGESHLPGDGVRGISFFNFKRKNFMLEMKTELCFNLFYRLFLLSKILLINISLNINI